ncbi:DUF1905 domain-containing protein [Pedobacter sp. HMF7647]|uniref:DUF1905 domain-containing protein n=1 Tax=Hufsiella arboris TaxID=2695275 RepID=A0A7K1Y641_9SPHI|nr:YdeI/OmpD-associated family protein [Hufsiella arboris]MXV49910.1 DUF1905 domain-containing protein [Hufsiella arboris]
MNFKARIYRVEINLCVDVPREVTDTMKPTKGYIRIKGTINGFNFIQTLVPVKNGPYRLFVNFIMLKGGKAVEGDEVSFNIKQNFTAIEKQYPMPAQLLDQLQSTNLVDEFEGLSPTRKKDILKYLSYVKTEETLQKNINKVLDQLRNNVKNVRIP